MPILMKIALYILGLAGFTFVITALFQVICNRIEHPKKQIDLGQRALMAYIRRKLS